MVAVKNVAVSRQVVDSAMSYSEYRKLIGDLLAEEKTTGSNHSESMIHYTKMNVHRMKRLDKQIELDPELEKKLRSIDRKLIWLVLTEAWCGDAAQLVPLMNRMAEVNPNIDLKLILRDEHPDIMDRFLTNGVSRSIPKLVCLEAESMEVLGDWGPRPEEARDLHETVRNMPGIASQEVSERLHKWYADNKTRSAQKEFLPLLEEWV